MNDQTFLPEHFINRELELAGVQRPRAGRGRRRDQPALGAGQVPVDLQLEPRRVLHGPRGGPARAGVWRRRPARLHARRHAADRASCSGSHAARRSWSPRSIAAGTNRSCRSWPSEGMRLLRYDELSAEEQRDARPLLPRAGVSDSHADGRRSGPSQPALSQPRPVPGGDARAAPRPGARSSCSPSCRCRRCCRGWCRWARAASSTSSCWKTRCRPGCRSCSAASTCSRGRRSASRATATSSCWSKRSDDMLRLIEDRLKARQRGEAVRLEVAAGADEELAAVDHRRRVRSRQHARRLQRGLPHSRPARSDGR